MHCQAASSKRTKIVCTLGPACSDAGILERMIRAGMDVARLNFSHGTYEAHGALLAALRQAEEAVGRRIGVLQDLCGPKIRAGWLPEEGVVLETGQEARFAFPESDRSLPHGVLPVEYEGLARDVKPGDRMLFDDGALEARVLGAAEGVVTVRLTRGGRLKSRKGMNLPGVEISAPSVTLKDLQDLEWGLVHGVDYVALSFVRQASDLQPVQERLAGVKDPPLLVAKIETPQAVARLEEILDNSDAVMVARGDLGVELDFEQVPLVQKRLIRLANERDVPAITATQMLESMTQSARPTRAEASDVANAVFDGTDAVMLSGETAGGRYPVEAVDAMARIVREAEGALLTREQGYLAAGREQAASCLHDALALGVERISRSLEVKAVVVATLGLSTAKYLASARPRVPVFGISPNPGTLGRLALLWGITPVRCPPFEEPTDALRHACSAVLASGAARPGDLIVLAVGRGPSREFSARIHVHQLTQDPGGIPALSGLA